MKLFVQNFEPLCVHSYKILNNEDVEVTDRAAIAVIERKTLDKIEALHLVNCEDEWFLVASIYYPPHLQEFFETTRIWRIENQSEVEGLFIGFVKPDDPGVVL